MHWHKLLNRQIRRNLGNVDAIPEDLIPFLKAINASYEHFEKDRKIIERAMELSAEELRSSIMEKEAARQEVKIKSEFLSLMSHEIRTPLNAVVGMSNILIQEDPREDQVEHLQILKFSANLLLSLINDVLDYNKMEAGKLELEQTPFDLRQLAVNLQRSFQSKADDKGLNLIFEVDQKIPDQVIGDPTRISQILINLMGNALKFTQEGAITTSFQCVHMQGNQTTIRFQVTDTGIGIPEDKMEEIFKSFSQAESNTTRKYGGTGLGLAITKNLLEQMQSTIKVESTYGKGSTFQFDLVVPNLQSVPLEEITSTEEEEASSFKGKRILLVEDNQINVLVATKILKAWDLDIDVAVDGQESVDMIQQKDYDLVLMDLHMPVMDGYDATEAIRKLSGQRFQSIPIIALTASCDKLSQNRVFDCGMNDIITKPFEPIALNQKLQEFLLHSLFPA